MAKIYGNPITFGGGTGGQNADLPPLLDNFKASAPVEGIPVKDMPVGTKIKVPVNTDYQSFLGENIVWLVADQNHAGYPANSSTLLSEKILLITVLDAKEPTNPDVYRAKYGNNMMPYANIQQWLNSDGEAGSWYIAQHTYDAPPIRDNFSDSSRENGVEIYNKPGFLKTLPNEFLKNIVESNFEYGDWDNSNTVKTFSSKFTIPSITELGIDAGTFVPTMLGIKFEIFNSFPFTGIYPTQECCDNGNYTGSNFNPDSYWGFWVRNTDDSKKNIADWSSIILYVGANGKVGSSGCVNPVNGVVPICNISNETILSPEPDSDGCYTLAELAPVTIAESDNYSVTLSADKMEKSRAEQLAGAVWVYGEHSPANVNDGTKIQLTREECVYIKPDFPEEPTEYTMIEDRTDTGEFVAPEDGWYQVVAVGGGGNGGDPYKIEYTNFAGGGGGSGGISAKSKIKLLKGEKIAFTIGSTINILDITVTSGLNGTSADMYQAGRGGDKGTALGGDISIDGQRGNDANVVSPGESVNTPNSYGVTSKGGKGGYYNSGTKINGEAGSKPFIRFYRGNTNIQSQRETSINPDTIVQKSIPWSKTKDFYARQFTYNSKKQYQTMLEGALASVIVEGAPAQVTDLVVSGSGGTATLTWVNPVDDPVYAETVVVQKVDSAPSDITDGTEIYRGTDQTCTATGLEQSTDYYFAVYTVSKSGIYAQPVVSEVYNYDFPAKPTEYTPLQSYNGDYGGFDEEQGITFTAPETGYFRFHLIACGGTGGKSYRSKRTNQIYVVGGGSGGTAAHAHFTMLLTKGEQIQMYHNGYVRLQSVFGNIIVNPGQVGGNYTATTQSGTGTGGAGGTYENTLTGNYESKIIDLVIENGLKGQNGLYRNWETVDFPTITGTAYVHAGSSNQIYTYKEDYSSYTTTIRGGQSEGYTSEFGNRILERDSETGTAVRIVIQRGNTNIPSPSQASALSLLPTDSALTVDWTNSGDPAQTGTMLVYNTDHTPTTTSDGVNVDIPTTQATAATFAVDGEEQQEDNKKQSYTITGLSNNKPVYVALFPYDTNKKYGIPKTDVEIPRVHSWYDTQQELQAEVATVKAEMADYQEYYVTTQEILK